MASVGQTSIARCAAAASASFSGCLKKYTAVSSSFVFRRLGASSRQVRHIVQVMSTYHAPGTFKGCLLALSAILSLFNQFGFARQCLFWRLAIFERAGGSAAPSGDAKKGRRSRVN